MRVTVKSVISFLLGLVFFGVYQGGKYFMNNRLQELAIVLALGLYFYSAVFTAFTDRTIRWAWWFWLTPLFVGYVMISSSLAFSINAGVSMVPSLFAAREFMILFLGPTVYFLYRLGFSLKKIENILIAAMVLVIFSYLFFYHTIDLRAAYFSKGYMFYLVTYDEWRGFRLKPPTYVLIILTFYGLMRIFQPSDRLVKTGFLILVALVGYIWFLQKARSQMATLVMSLMIYPILFKRPNRMNLFILVAPLGVMLLIAGSDILVDKFMNAEGAEVRAASYKTAWTVALKLPVFGYGQSSAFSKTYQDIFGGKFFPDDLGLIGMTFKYGFIGLAMYLFFNFYTATRILKANWYYYRHHKAHNPLLWALFIQATASTTNMMLVPGLAYAEGLATGSLAIALTACYYEEFGIKPGKAKRSKPTDLKPDSS